MSIVVNQYEKNGGTGGRVDGKQTLLTCSGCDKELCYVWANQPSKKVDFKIVAKCCYCDDKSFPIEIHGGFAVRGYDRKLEGSNLPEDVRPVVDIVNVDYSDDDCVVIETEKV